MRGPNAVEHPRNMEASRMCSTLRRVVTMLVVVTCFGAATPATAGLPFGSQLAELKRVLQGKRVGLLTCPTAVDARFNLIADRLAEDPEITLVCFFAPEHGLRGDRQAGGKVTDYRDPVSGLPVYSVYSTRRAPAPEHLEQLDVIVCDMQDVGVRFYTRAWTMTLAMQAAAQAGKEFVVFDRPNPIGLQRVSGAPNTIDAGLIGPLWPGQPFGVATRHGMTMGEIATLVNAEWAQRPVRLTVVKVPGYRRSMSFEETGYPWVLPSPNMPTLETAAVYPGTCIFEGTNLSEGRGTTRPFELVGAPFIDAVALAERLNAARLAGVRFRAAWFIPTFDDHDGERCAGVQLHVTDEASFEPIRTGLTMLKVVCEMYPEQVVVKSWASRLMGVPDLHKRIRTESVDALMRGWESDLKAFKALRKAHLLYP
jgi:uncharacterized protein YbbC (DUF1343 family)